MCTRKTMANMDAHALVSSSQWLQCHGLKRKKLTMLKILAQLGFQHKEDYVNKLGRPVSSRYSHGLFRQYKSDGKIYNLTAKKEQVLQKVESITDVIDMYTQRLDWLTGGSRAIFGVIQEQSIVIVVDLAAVSKVQYDLCRDSLCLVLREQVAQTSKFNIIWVSKEPLRWNQKAVHVSQQSIDAAVEWIWNLDHYSAANVQDAAAAEAISEAFNDQVDAVYYFSVGDIPAGKKQLLKQSISNSPYPVHTVAYAPQIYLDDILVFSATLNEHRDHVSQVLTLLWENHLYCKLEKCDFDSTSLAFLGYVISDQGLTMDPQKPCKASLALPITIAAIRRTLLSAQMRQKEATDRYRSLAPHFDPGDMVWLSAKNIKLLQPSGKLGPCYLGPFRVEAWLSPVSYRLNLPATLRIHPVFHVSLLKPHVPAHAAHPPSTPPPPVSIDCSEVCVIDAVLNSRLFRGALQYLVNWKGYNPEDRSWVAAADVHTPSLLCRFHSAFPSKPSVASWSCTKSSCDPQSYFGNVRTTVVQRFLATLSCTVFLRPLQLLHLTETIHNTEFDTREDELLITKELDEAQNTLTQLQDILKTLYFSEEENNNDLMPLMKREDCVSSKEWLKKYGLKSQKLQFYDALADCAFRHSDGLVNIKIKPEDESVQTDAENKMKLINAKYCDRFVHTHWKDGSVVHLYISKEKCRWYEERMKTALEQMERRVKWLKQGSRELFGTILENHVYILIDTSLSMKDKLFLVKEKIFQLMQEQLRYKRMFNFVKFDSRVEAWKSKLAEVNEDNLKGAWFWVKELEVGSSTNTLRALQVALTDSKTEAVYLLTDGRPDQPAKTILAQVSAHKPIPIHTISFNCDDTEANSFLYQLSSQTGGRFHSYSSYLRDSSAPQPFVSEDIQLLLKEIEQGKADLEKMQKFHTECLMLDWYNNGDKDQFNIIQSATPPTKTKSLPKGCLDMSTSRWLKAHSLVARRLTIMDALAPTTVPHTAKYVPILDKHVLSKVFDEVLPLAHVSGNKKLITLINPQAVNLGEYKQKLGKAIKNYERRLNLVIWRALSQEERDKFESDIPISYSENKEALLQALDRLGWPISAEDITLLEDEIDAGKTYLQQASDLQEATKSVSFKGNSKGQREKEDINKQNPNIKQRSKMLDTLRGQKVIARSDVDGFYYQGTVVRSINSKCALVDFCQGENQIIPIKFIIQTGGALPCPPLKVGDFVFSKTGTGSGCYVPAVVIATPRTDAEDKLFSVLKYNNRKEHCLRSELFKISQSQFTFSCRFIREAQMVDYTIPNVQIVKPLMKPTRPQEEHKRKKERERSHRSEEKLRRDQLDDDITSDVTFKIPSNRDSTGDRHNGTSCFLPSTSCVPWIKSFASQLLPPPVPVVIDAEEEYEVHDVLDSCWSKSRLECLLHWKEYGPEERFWEPVCNMLAPSSTFDSIDTILDTLDTIFDSMDTIFDSLDTILNSMDTMFDSTDTIFDSINTIFDSLDTIFDSMDTIFDSMDTIFDSIDTIFDSIDTRALGTVHKDGTTLRDPMERKLYGILKRQFIVLGQNLKAATAVACLTPTIRIWLTSLEETIESNVSRLKLLKEVEVMKEATNFSFDSSLDIIRLMARLSSFSVAARRALWLKSWNADTPSKSKMVALPFIDIPLFGKYLEDIIKKVSGGKSTFLPQEYRPRFSSPRSSGSKTRNPSFWEQPKFQGIPYYQRKQGFAHNTRGGAIGKNFPESPRPRRSSNEDKWALALNPVGADRSLSDSMGKTCEPGSLVKQLSYEVERDSPRSSLSQVPDYSVPPSQQTSMRANRLLPKTSTSRSPNDSSSFKANSLTDRKHPSRDINRKLENLALQITQYLHEQKEQQQSIQECLKKLAVLQSHQDKCGLEEEQKDLVKQQIDLLQQLKMLTPINNIQYKKDDLSHEQQPGKSLQCPLVPGQKVLALCSHNGWYEEGCVVHDCGDFSYFVQKSSGEMARIWREDMFSDADDYRKEIKEEDAVIAPHPLHHGTYCPGVVLKIMPDLRLVIRYYDQVEDLVPREHVYLTSPERFDRNIKYILECEERWVGQAVVARNDNTGTFHLAEVHKRIGNGKQFVISWADGKRVIQDIEWIFGKLSQPHVLNVGDHVLSLASPSTLTFLPGRITGHNGPNLKITFCNGQSSQSADPHQCFGLSEKKFNLAVQFFHQQNKKRDASEDDTNSENEDSLSDISSVTITSTDSDTGSHISD
ncbi:von Willebrand factor A domain-containing protein 3B [Rhinophrynus dorsalis]